MTKPSLLLIAVITGSIMVFASPQHDSSPRCKAPAYRVAQTYSAGKGLRALSVSIKAHDATVGQLVALGCQLQVEYPQESIVEVDIFNDYEAAKHTAVHSVETLKGSNKAAYVAYYYLNRAEAKETLTLVVDPGHPCDNDIEINLRSHQVGFVRCK